MSQDSTKLPKVFNEQGLPQAKRWGTFAAKITLRAAYRSLQPTTQEAFSQAPDQRRLRRFYAETEDGWHLPIYQLPVIPQGSGEPILLAHDLGFNHHSLQLHRDHSLAWALQNAGFAVFFLAHRGDHGTLAPTKVKPWDFDTIAQFDVPAVVDAILERTGFEKLSWVGHGFGGQLLYAYLANTTENRISSASCLCAAVRFASPRSHARAMRMVLGLLPANFELPTRTISRALSPALKSGSAQMKHLGLQSAEGETARGLLLHGTENLGAGLLRQVLGWAERGFLSDRSGNQDLAACMEGTELPMQLIASKGDDSCPPAAAFAVADFLDGPIDTLTLDTSWGHRDPLLSPKATTAVFPQVVTWMNTHRKLAWGHVVDVQESETSRLNASAMDNGAHCAKAS
jgi:pimeloyl-ACP methyl ester carboxylesterase